MEQVSARAGEGRKTVVDRNCVGALGRSPAVSCSTVHLFNPGWAMRHGLHVREA